MIIYRPHRGGLREAMEEAMEFDTYDDLNDYLVKQCVLENSSAFEKEDIVVSKETYDDSRIGWKNWRYVGVKKFMGKEKEPPLIIGMCATDYGSLEQSKKMCEKFLNR